MVELCEFVLEEFCHYSEAGSVEEEIELFVVFLRLGVSNVYLRHLLLLLFFRSFNILRWLSFMDLFVIGSILNLLLCISLCWLLLHQHSLFKSYAIRLSNYCNSLGWYLDGTLVGILCWNVQVRYRLLDTLTLLDINCFLLSLKLMSLYYWWLLFLDDSGFWFMSLLILTAVFLGFLVESLLFLCDCEGNDSWDLR